MNATPPEFTTTLDESILSFLEEQLGCPVRYFGGEHRDGSGDGVDAQSERLCKLAAELSPRAVSVIDETTRDGEGPTRCNLAIRLPQGGVAAWKSDANYARQSAAHASLVLALHVAEFEREQLRAEADALATQVVNDFEELSLIRSLASSMELPSGTLNPIDLALKSLRPLADGVGALSIAAVFLSDDGETMSDPCWSGPIVGSTEQMHQLIERYRTEVEQQPVVRNEIPDSDQNDEHPLKEFILVPCRSEGRLHGWLIACNRIEDVHEHVPWAQLGFSTVQASLLETTTHQLASQLHNLRLLRQKEDLFTEVVRALVNAVEARDPYTSGHSERVACSARFLGELLGLQETDCERIYLTGLLHDVGKIAVPDGVLRKPGHLDEKERAIIETHTEAGWRILHELDALKEVLPGVLYHHEHYDGKGYPDGLAGEDIPLDGRILAVCDAFDAMTSDRPYRDGMPVEKAIAILREGAGRFWDPNLIGAFVKNSDQINRIRLDHRPRQLKRRAAMTALSEDN